MPITRFDSWKEARNWYQRQRGVDILPIYERMRQIAARHQTIAYMRLPLAQQIGRRWIGEIVGCVSEEEVTKSGRLLSVLVVRSDTGLPGVGFFLLDTVIDRHGSLRPQKSGVLTAHQRQVIQIEQTRAWR